ncbi:hypothetical protein Tco_1465958 [Tanacetum coccineum]
MNITGAFVKPKGITVNSKCPYRVLNLPIKQVIYPWEGITVLDDGSGCLLDWANGQDPVLNQGTRLIPGTIKGKPLVLPYGRTPRLDSDVRVSQILGFPSISLGPVDGPKWDPLQARKAFDAFCEKLHIPEEVDPILPGRGDTMHKRPARKIGLYTRLFLCFYVNSKKSGWMSFSKHSDNAPVCYMKPIDSLKNWNDYFFWVDEFACPAPFPWHTARYVTRDPAMVAADFNVQDYATLFAHPSPFWKFPEEFMCLIRLSRHYTLDEETHPWFLHKNGEEMDIFAFIHTLDPTKVKVVEWERIKDEPPFLETTIGHTVPLLPVAPDHAESELKASVQVFVRLLDEGGSVSEVVDTAVEDVAPVQPKRKRKRKTVVVDAGESSHPPKRLREDHGTLSVASVDGKSMSAVQRLLAEAVRNADVRGEAILTLPFMTSFVSAMPEREGGDHTDFVVGPNLRTISAPQRYSILVMIAVTTVTSTVDPALVVKEKPVKPSLFFVDSSSAGGDDPNTGVFSDLTGSDFLVGGICTVIDPDIDL